MSYYAIGIVRDKSGRIGVRILNKETSKCIDIDTSEIPLYQSKFGIDNIKMGRKGEVKWEHGSADRYPIIDMISGYVKNDDSAIILGSSNSKTSKQYLVANYIGETAIVSSEQLINYGKQHKLANCKITKNRSQTYISGIGWTIEELRTDPSYKFYVDRGYLEIDIPFYTSDTLRVPNLTATGRLIEEVYSIKVKPAIMANRIKKLILESNIHNITYGVVSSLPNLEHIESESKQALIYDEAFVGLRHLKTAKFNGIEYLGKSSFSSLKELTSVTAVKPPRQIQLQAFKGCSSFDINSILTEGVEVILSKSFEGCNKATKIVIPSTVRYMDTNVFINCTNLTEVNCLTESLDIGKRRQYSPDSGEALFQGNINTIKMYVGKHMRLNGNAGSNVEVIIRDETDRDKAIDNKIRKSNMVGMRINTHEKISSSLEIAKIIAAAKPSEVKNMVDTLITSGFKSRDWVLSRIFDFSGIKIEVGISTNGWKKAKSIKDIGRAYVLKNPGLTIIPYDGKMLKAHFEGSSVNKYRNSSSYRFLRGITFPIIMPGLYESKYVKSIAIADNGMIRLIYNKPNTGVEVLDIYDYQYK